MPSRFYSCQRLGMTFPNDIAQREAYILEQVQNGNYSAKWAWVKSTNGTSTAYFRVMSDALEVDGTRINVSARLEQQIADVLGCMLLTPKLADMIWMQRALTLIPYPRQITSSTQAMIEHSGKIDSGIAATGQDPDSLICTVGKHWVLDKALNSHPGKAENYGWHFAGASFQGITGEVCASLIKDPATGMYYRLIQGCGWAHDISHVDYSQTCVLVRKKCLVEGNRMNLSDVLSDATLAPLVSHNGVTTIFRQPGVPELSQVAPDDDEVPADSGA